MKYGWVPFLLAFLYFGLQKACAQTYDSNNVWVQTFVGSGFNGYVDGQGTETMFSGIQAIVVDSESNLLVLDGGRIRKITPSADVSTVQSISLTAGFSSMTIDHSNVLWIAPSPLHIGARPLTRIDTNGNVTTTNLSVAGTAYGLCVDSVNNLYISDYDGNHIYRWKTNGVLTVFAGSGNSGSTDGNGVFCSFNNPKALACDTADNIYVWDSGNSKVRKINQNRDVTTIAGKNSSNADGTGTNASFGSVSAMVVDNSGNVYLACGTSIRKMTTATDVTTVAGSFSQSGYTNDVAGSLARFNGATGLCISQGMIFVGDTANYRVRNITFDPVAQLVPSANLDVSVYAGIKVIGTVGRSYRVESSTDMNAWSTETTLLLTSSPFLWIDQNAVGQKKFYRAFLLP